MRRKTKDPKKEKNLQDKLGLPNAQQQHITYLLMLLRHLRSLGTVSKLKLMKILPPDVIASFIERNVLIQETDVHGLPVFKVNDELFS